MTVKAHRDPLKAGDDLRRSDFFIVQTNILFFTRVTLAICINLSSTGFISVSCFWLRMSRDHHMADKILRAKKL